MSAPDNAQPSIDLNEIIAEMDELGRAKFDAALERVKVRKLQEQNQEERQELLARIAELESQRADEELTKQRGVEKSGPKP